MRLGKFIAALAVIWVLSPGTAHAQAALAGVVKDSSGAVLPGVTVEAASPVLIEKTRSAVTDGTGQYQITNLRPGTYTLTFSLPGFTTVKREGVELAGTATISINTDMKLGAVQETITVTGETPVVDVQNSRQQAVLDKDTIRDIPTSRQYYSVATLIPGVSVTNQSQDVGGSATISTPDYQIHGGLPGDGRLTVDGLSVGSARASGANRSMYVVNVGIAQETNITTSGGLGEAETAGVAFNVVPREGGNTYRGSWYVGWANSAMQGSNYSDALKTAGLSAPNSLQKVWEVTPTVGGPLKKDKVWFFFAARHQGTRNTIAGMYYNLNAGDPTKWTYAPDLNRQAVDDGTWKSASTRLTWQVNARNKVNVFWDEQDRKVGWVGGGNATTSPEATGVSFGHPDRVGQIAWASPVTSRILVEVAAGAHQLQWNAKERPGYDDTFGHLIRATDQGGNGFVPGITYRGQVWASDWSGTYPIRASISYVTGAHSAKVGLLRTWYTTNDNNFDPNAINYTFNNGVPIRLQLVNKPQNIREQHTTLGLYAQDSWVIDRLTVQAGVRYDRMTQVFPAQVVGFTPFIPNGFTIPEDTTSGVRWNDITPRFSAAYNLTGDGKTAVKVSLGKYMLAQDGGGTFGSSLNPQLRMALGTVNRSWNDNLFPVGDPRRGNFIPDCNMFNNAVNGECGAVSDPNWGTATIETQYDDKLTHGWGVRPYQWEFTASVQRQLLPRVGANVGYFRRSYGNFVVTDNLAVTAADFDQFTIPVPTDASLPGGGGNLTFLNVKPALFGVTNNFVTSASNYGTVTQGWQGVDVNFSVRASKGLTFAGGTSTGRATLNLCDVAAKLPEILQNNIVGSVTSAPSGFINGVAAQYPMSYCNVVEPYLTQIKGLGSYLVPKIDVLVAATFQSAPGPELGGIYNVPNSIVQPSLGRLISGTTSATQTTAVDIVQPGALIGDRTNQLDLRFAKIVKYGRTRTNIGVDLYNALNANPVTSFNQIYVAGKYLSPQSIMPARFVKFSAQVDW